jgi:hypothetical protein
MPQTIEAEKPHYANDDPDDEIDEGWQLGTVDALTVCHTALTLLSGSRGETLEIDPATVSNALYMLLPKLAQVCFCTAARTRPLSHHTRTLGSLPAHRRRCARQQSHHHLNAHPWRLTLPVIDRRLSAPAGRALQPDSGRAGSSPLRPADAVSSPFDTGC